MNYCFVQYKNNEYCIIDTYNKLPVVIDKEDFDKIKDKNITVGKNLHIYINNDNNTQILLSKIILNEYSKKIYHKNRFNYDNRKINLTFNQNSVNYNGKTRIIHNIKIPKYIYYDKGDKNHGDKFYINIDDKKIQSTSSKNYSIYYKFEEIKKIILLLKEKNIELYNKITNYLNEEGEQLKLEFLDIITLNNNFKVDDIKIYNNVKYPLKSSYKQLSNIEKIMIDKKYNIDFYI